MSEWVDYDLKDVVEKFIDYRGKTPNKTAFGIPLVTAKIVKNGRIQTPNEFIAFDNYATWMRRGYPEIDDVVMTTEAPLGEVALLKDKNVALAQRIIIIRGKKELSDNTFIKYYLQSPFGQEELQGRASGTTVEGIKAAELRKITISLPPLPEQRAIAGVLSSLDDKIDLLHRQNKTLEGIAKVLWHKMFVEEANEEWVKLQFIEIANLQRGISYAGNLLGEDGNGVPMHNLNSIDINGSYKYDGIKFYKGVIKEYQKLKPGDLLIINTDITQENRIIGWPILVPINFTKSTFTHHLYSVTLQNNSVSKFFLYYLLRHKDYRDVLKSSANGTTVTMLSKEAIYSLQISIPPVAKQKEFENIISVILNKQYSNHHQIDALSRLRDNLLPKLISGEVRVKTEIK
jgi:type I restriction enzyme, S subunit